MPDEQNTTDWLGRRRFCVGVRYDYPTGEVLCKTVWQRGWDRWSAALLGLWHTRRESTQGWSKITVESVPL